MKLITWNVAGRSSRATAQVQAISEHLPELVALQEVTETSRVPLRRMLVAKGYIFVADSFDLAPDTSVLAGPRRYGQITASRYPLKTLSPDEFDLPWPERVLSVVAYTPAGPIEIHNTHVPLGCTNKWVKIQQLNGIFRRLARSASRPRILCGDFNTPQAETAEGGIITWAYKKVGARYLFRPSMNGGKGEDWDAGERNVLQNLRDYDLRDAFRLINGYGDTAEGSWKGRRYDHTFASISLRPRAARYIHRWPERGLSDHSALEVIFNYDCEANNSSPPSDLSGLRSYRAEKRKVIVGSGD